ncbi:N-acetylneuraminate synthase family protein [Dyadobacter bucti]|uniref:N-acetylneuraminate synthase family protein n=1 Tax=Dyadobacter bucti TaxID=2572203 RepID=UPI0011089283|nr:N-acetylneuraminate synthase family protein [Dyadobacter bucti]
MINLEQNGIYIIGEIGQAHEGSLGMAHSYIDALAGIGVNAAKFQVHIAEAESSMYEGFRAPFSYEDASRFAYWKRMEFTREQWAGLRNHCHDKNLDFLASPFSVKSVELLEKVGTDKFKIGSGEINNLLMIRKIAETKKEIILSSGMSSYDELDRISSFLKTQEVKFSILQCTTSYPTRPEQWGLNVIPLLKERYAVKTGFSDHSGDIYACLAATALGAEILEFHIVYDQRMFGPDARSSLTVDQAEVMVKGVRQIESALNSPVNKTDNQSSEFLKTLFGKSLAVNKKLKKGHSLCIQDFESKKPGDRGIPALDYESIINRKLNKDLAQWDFVTLNDLI